MVKYLVSITLLATVLATVQAQLKGYPPSEKVPDVKSAQVKAWLKEVDLSGAPKIPIAKGRPGDAPKCNKRQLPNECHWTCFDCAADDITVCPRANTWGLTFDDGPTAATPVLLDYLKSKRLNATFFLIGSNVAALPKHVQREVAEGHHLASHTWSHTALTTLTNEQIVAEMKWTEKAVLEATGLRLKYMRPPFGDINNRVRYVLKKLGYLVVDWTGDEFDTNDWDPELSDSKKIALMTKSLNKYAAGKRTKGFYMLEHDQSASTVKLAPKLLPLGIARNISFGNVPVCQGDSQPYQTVVKAPVV
ncbi:chitin deacetylase [Linnemannia gamsii]|uniref:Chitin deacetylase n=1 Tax=Linnemannia gamsii TaxID=64522 RepID=A0ABQ7JTE7_9FUNG|nr:chitin deacetylase [Linnemannia gamsii]